jgi:hypothetical protein
MDQTGSDGRFPRLSSYIPSSARCRAGGTPSARGDDPRSVARALYELEVLALEVSGNQTISVGFLKTA